MEFRLGQFEKRVQAKQTWVTALKEWVILLWVCQQTWATASKEAWV